MVRLPEGTRAHGFYMATCSDPKCGPHLVAFDHNERPFCDIAIPLSGIPSLIQALQDFAYVRVVEKDKDHGRD